MLGMFVGELSRNLKRWIERLQQDPQSLSQIEQEVAGVSKTAKSPLTQRWKVPTQSLKSQLCTFIGWEPERHKA
jgi:hypothetical protein